MLLLLLMMLIVASYDCSTILFITKVIISHCAVRTDPLRRKCRVAKLQSASRPPNAENARRICRQKEERKLEGPTQYTLIIDDNL